MPSRKKVSEKKSSTEQIEIYPSIEFSAKERLEAKVIESNTLVITNIENPANNNLTLIEFNDLIGLQVDQESENVAKLSIYATKLEAKKQDSDKSNRKNMDFVYYSKNAEQLKSFRDCVLKLLWEFNQKTYQSGIDAKDSTYVHDSTLQSYEKKILCVICPKSGTGNAQALFNQAEPYLLSNGFVIDTLITKHKENACDHLYAMESSILQQYYAIFCFSGDGVIHEILNGFYKRSDHQDLNLRLAPVLGGSACGMTLSILKEWNYEQTMTNIIYVLTRARFRPLTVTKYLTNGPNDVIYGCIGYLFGFYSDVDFNSESKWFKWLGSWRFDTYGVLKLFNLSKRKAKIWTSEKAYKDQLKDDLIVQHFLAGKDHLKDWALEDETFYNFLYLTSPEWTQHENISTDRNLGDLQGEVISSTEKDGFFSFLSNLVAVGDKNYHTKYPEGLKKVKSFRMELEDLHVWNVKNTPINIDGEKYQGTIVQGTVVEDEAQKVRIIA